MSRTRIACVVPTVRPELMEEFRKAWTPLFERHGVTLVTVWDGDQPFVSVTDFSRPAGDTGRESTKVPAADYVPVESHGLFCRHTDAVRNYGFFYCAFMGFTHVLTLDDDVRPTSVTASTDPIHRHLVTLDLRVPISWMNTADYYKPVGDRVSDSDPAQYLRGFPYGVRDEAPVMLSHGVWIDVPDFDGETQLRLEKTTGVPKYLPYHVGPIPKHAYFPLCGMNVMVRAAALPYLYFAPMGPDSGFPKMQRFADILMGVCLKQEFDRLGWACYTGASVVSHSRASDAARNFEQEKLGRDLNEEFWNGHAAHHPYTTLYHKKRWDYYDLIRGVSCRPGSVHDPEVSRGDEAKADFDSAVLPTAPGGGG